MIYMLVTFHVKPSTVEQIDKASENLIQSIKEKEPGVILYDILKNPEKAEYYHLFSFANSDAEKSHRASAHVKTFMEILYKCCDSMPDFIDLDLVVSKTRP